MIGLFADLTYQPPPTPEAPSAAHLIVRLFVLTGILIGICLAVWWASRRFQRVCKPGTKVGEMEYQASMPLDRRCALHLVRSGDQTVVIGTDLTGVKATVVLPESFSASLDKALARPVS